MSYRVEIETSAIREFQKLPKEAKASLGDVLDNLEREPRPLGAKKLINQEGYRIRKGDYRILYAVDDKALVVQVYRIGHRRDVYRHLR
ncbi:MAG: type II toxin-antitoxin system RelE/ParE family toxin [Pseudomonadota bacterium]